MANGENSRDGALQAEAQRGQFDGMPRPEADGAITSAMKTSARRTEPSIAPWSRGDAVPRPTENPQPGDREVLTAGTKELITAASDAVCEPAQAGAQARSSRRTR